MCSFHNSPQPLSLLASQGWADQMFDASGKLPGPGVLQGNLHSPGTMESCLKVEEYLYQDE